MERTVSPEEKIRRAEEIYLRRKQGSTTRSVATVNVSEEKDYGLFKKMILQIVICLVIYFIFYLIQNSNYVFSEDVINKTKEILSYDIDIQAMYTQVMERVTNFSNGIVVNENNGNTVTEGNGIILDSNTVNNNTVEINAENNSSSAINENPVIDAIGGAEIENVAVEAVASVEESENAEEQKEDTTPQTDEEYIKSNFSFIKPVEGIVSSEFGLRDVDNPIVSKNHAGIDIAANTGTVIKASMEGTVTICSTTGDYGYHIKITNNDVSTLYAHCSKLYVKQGDTIKQGQEIAEVGSTGKSTGPHLHFEIMRKDVRINPRDILEF